MARHFSFSTDFIFRKKLTGHIIGKKSHLGAQTETSNFFLWPNISLKSKLVFCAFRGNRDGVTNL